MSVLILDSTATFGAAIDVPWQQAGEDPPLQIGGISNAFAGNERSSVRAEKQRWSSLTSYVDAATKEAIKTRIAKGRQLTCNGDLLNNVATVCAWSYGGASMTPGFASLWTVKISGREV